MVQAKIEEDAKGISSNDLLQVVSDGGAWPMLSGGGHACG